MERVRMDCVILKIGLFSIHLYAWMKSKTNKNGPKWNKKKKKKKKDRHDKTNFVKKLYYKVHGIECVYDDANG